MATSKKQKGGGCKKAGRTKRKALRSGSPLSLFVRDKITGEAYFKQTR